MSSVRILAIAPYPGMVPSLKEVAANYPDVALTIDIGDLDVGVERAQRKFEGHYDVVISRGGTAQMLGHTLLLPVVEITTSVYDVLCTLRLAGSAAAGAPIAVVGYANIMQDLELLQGLLPYQLDSFPITSAEHARKMLQEVKKQGYGTILCDMVSYTEAQDMGFNAFLITSSKESIKTAFEKAMFFCSANRQLRMDNHFLHQLLREHMNQTVVFTTDGKLYFSTLREDNGELLDLMRSKIEEVAQAGHGKYLRQYHGKRYHIKATRITVEKTPFISFYFYSSLLPVASEKHGISYKDCDQVEQENRQSIFGITNLAARYKPAIEQASIVSKPVFIYGEVGTGKEYIAKKIYLEGQAVHNPFIEIDCNLLSHKSWQYLIEHHNSPLCDTDNTLFFHNLHALSPTQWRQLLAFLLEGKVAVRNRLIFAAVQTTSEYVGDPQLTAFIEQLACFPLYLNALRNQPNQLDMALKLYLNHQIITTGKPIRGVSQDALDMLHQYPWVHNYRQFHRVMERIVSEAAGLEITLDDVKSALLPELDSGQTDVTGFDVPSLDLARPLEEINRDIVRIILDKNDGNQSQTAQSLGISRTTLWRMLRK